LTFHEVTDKNKLVPFLRLTVYMHGTTRVLSKVHWSFTLQSSMLSDADRSRRWPLSETIRWFLQLCRCVTTGARHARADFLCGNEQITNSHKVASFSSVWLCNRLVAGQEVTATDVARPDVVARHSPVINDKRWRIFTCAQKLVA